MGSCAAPSAKGDDKFITTDYLQQCRIFNVARHLILPNPFISFDEMVQGLTTMIMSYINTEMARSEDQS
ncbi:putative transposase [Acinetobacter baumannii 1064293_46]|nr:putative transposase [Acinetobacter baumannii 1064293_46]